MRRNSSNTINQGTRLRWIISAQVVWLSVVFLLGAWWGRLVLRQAARIAELERQIGLDKLISQGHWIKTQRMLFWESSTYYLLLLASTLLLLWLYWRDVKRARGIQAFFASVTHELRTPLTSIRLQAESIAENIPKKSPDRSLVERLLEDTQRLESQVERTLELARIEGGGPVFTQSLDFKPWLEKFIGSWNENHGNALDIKIEVTDQAIDADPVAVQVILKNLLENSLRHAKKEKPLVRLNLTREGEFIILNYTDNGDGFSGDVKKLGELFHKSPTSQGAGVGLYLVTVLMKKMGGGVEFSGKPEFSARLRFRQGEEIEGEKSHG